jgi:hypothetical protein
VGGSRVLLYKPTIKKGAKKEIQERKKSTPYNQYFNLYTSLGLSITCILPANPNDKRFPPGNCEEWQAVKYLVAILSNGW